MAAIPPMAKPRRGAGRRAHPCKDARPRSVRTMVGMRLSALRLPQFSGGHGSAWLFVDFLSSDAAAPREQLRMPSRKSTRRSGPLVRKWVTLARCYSDILRFWTTCANKKCRRSRRCLDRSGQCWNVRYPRIGQDRERFRARVVLKRRGLPAALREWQRLHDAGDHLL